VPPPEYLRNKGRPQHPDDLAHHECILMRFMPRIGVTEQTEKAVVAHAQRYIADARKQRLVEKNAAILHTQRVKAALVRRLSPLRQCAQPRLLWQLRAPNAEIALTV
jgi:hypothetical protein